jgi:uncharacterized protein involved in exopolysaccharide biosynthesis
MNPEHTTATDPQTSDIDLLTLIALLVRKRRLLLVWALVSAFVGLLVALLWKPYYTSTAVIMPPQQQQSIASIMSSQIPQIAGAGNLASLGLKNPGDIYVGIMQGRSVTDAVIDKLHLDTVFRKKLRSETRSALQRAVSFESARDGLIRITAEANTPALASDIANAYVEALYNMNARLAITEAAQRRLFYQQQVDEEKQQLTAAEDSLKAIQQQTGMIQPSGQTELLLQEIASIRGEITNKEVQLRSLGTFATVENPEVQQAQQELNALRDQLAKLENRQLAASLDKLSNVSSASEVPAAGLTYLRKLRDVQYHETLFALLSKQLEAARLDEAKSADVLQVVDRAEPADRKTGPSRILIVLMSAIAGAFFTGLVLLFMEVVPVLRSWLQHVSEAH